MLHEVIEQRAFPENPAISPNDEVATAFGGSESGVGGVHHQVVEAESEVRKIIDQ